MSRKLLAVGMVGSAITALCCVTPLLPVALGAVGLGALASTLYTDAVLLPVLAGFVLLTCYAVWRRIRRGR